VLEGVLAHALEGHGLQEARGDDAIGVDVVAGHGDAAPRHLAALEVGGAHFKISLTSVTTPVIAAAATIAGLMSNVRPVGLPCRPMKFRLLDDALISRPCSLSSFMPRHMEQPALRHWKPAAWKISCRPSASAALATCWEPGTMRARTCLATLPFLATSAATLKSDSRPLVHEPTKATSIRAPLIGWPAAKPMWARASRKVGRSGSGCASGEGMRWLTPTDISGLMPHVTTGSMDTPSIFLTSSNEAPGSGAVDFHHVVGRSKASRAGAGVAQLARPRADRDGAAGAVRRRMAGAARDGHAALREAQLRPDDVDDALLARRHVEELQIEVLHVAVHVRGHLLRLGVGVGTGLVGRRDDVIERAERALRHAHLELQLLEHLEGLRRRDLVDEVQADQELRLAGGQR